MSHKRHVSPPNPLRFSLFAFFAALILSACGSTPPAVSPQAPSNVRTTALEGAIQIDWDDNSANETGFVISRKTDAGVYAELITLGADTETYMDSNVTASSAYQYRVAAKNSSGMSNPVETPASVSPKVINNGEGLKLQSVTSMGHTTILASFNKALGEGATDVKNYSFNADLKAVAVTLSSDKKKVNVTTEEQVAANYTLSVSGIKDETGGTMGDASETNFSSSAAGTEAQLYLVDAFALSDTQVLVLFNREVDGSAATVANYNLSPSLNITAAQLSPNKTEVVLTTFSQSKTNYTLTIADGVQDSAGGAINPEFKSDSFAGVSAGSEVLRVETASSRSGTEVKLNFNTAAGEGAEDPANYEITAPSPSGETGRAILVVTEAALSLDKTEVTLTTLSQSNLDYSVKVTSVKDLESRLIDSTANEADFIGKQGSTSTDTDKDGLTDVLEQEGWVVTIDEADTELSKRHLTSDPTKKDTDDDGVNDNTERIRALDPRNADTDADGLSDADEVNRYGSNAANRDSTLR